MPTTPAMIQPHESPGSQSPPVTRERVHARTRELAIQNGRQAHQVTRSDYERAKREVTGEREPYRQDGLLDSTAFWRPDPVRS